MKAEKILLPVSVLLGVSMFVFGVLKFVDPFKGWYAVQITGSGLGSHSYWLGIAGEIAAGVILLSSVLFRKRLSLQLFRLFLTAASVLVIAMMLTGIYVHLHNNVPASVLPLKIKPPFIPGGFLLLAMVNLVLVQRGNRHVEARDISKQ